MLYDDLGSCIFPRKGCVGPENSDRMAFLGEVKSSSPSSRAYYS